MATDLYFNLSDTLRLAEHAVAAPEHSPSGSEKLDRQPCPGGLAWVADWGTYLMSTGVPGLRVDPDDPNSSNVAVYAEGWGPDSDRTALARTDVGGDDFVDHLHLSTVDRPGQVPLIDQLRAGAQRGDRYLVLRVAGDTVDLLLSRTGPTHPAAVAAPQPAHDARGPASVSAGAAGASAGPPRPDGTAETCPPALPLGARLLSADEAVELLVAGDHHGSDRGALDLDGALIDALRDGQILACLFADGRLAFTPAHHDPTATGNPATPADPPSAPEP